MGQNKCPGPNSFEYLRSLWLFSIFVVVVLLILGLKKGQRSRWMKSAALLVKLIGIINTSLVVK